MTAQPDFDFKDLNRLVGSWTTRATHPALPGIVVHGSAKIEWLEGNRFLICRATNDHPDFPDSISIIGRMGIDRADSKPNDLLCQMHYFDSRGVSRVYDSSLNKLEWRLWRHSPGFSQRFTGTFLEGGATIRGLWEMSQDDLNWSPDLEITYRRSE